MASPLPLVLALLAWLAPAIPAHASTLSATLDRDVVALGESVTLTLSGGDDVDSAVPPDLTPLESDFDVLRQASSSSVQIVNGRRSETRGWIVTLAPKASGRFTIPSLDAGGASSEPLALEVREGVAGGADGAGGANAAPGRDGVAVEWRVADGTRHVHEEIPLTLIVTSPLELRQATLEEPSGDDFTLTHTGKDRERVIDTAAGPARVIERDYRLRPRRAGALVVPPTTLRARVSDPGAARTLFDGMGLPDVFARAGMGRGVFGRDPFADVFGQGREITARSAPLTLDVLEAPATANGWFLPARRVELQESWARGEEPLRVGEATVRTIRVLALGATREQLPELSLGEPEGARTYVDRTRDRVVDSADGPVAVREIDLSIVPTRAGELVLPPIELAWWDTEADVERIATLEGRTLPVAAGAGHAASAAGAGQTGTLAPATSSGDAKGGITEAITSSGATRVALAAGVTFVVALGGAALVRWRRRRVPPGTPSDSRRPPRTTNRADAERHAREALSRCRENDARRAYEAVRRWQRSTVDRSSASTPALAPEPSESADSVLERELAALEAHLFAADPGAAWDGMPLATAVSRARRARRRRSNGERATRVLPALYPTRA